MKYLCKKNLYMKDGTRSFRNGSEYESLPTLHRGEDVLLLFVDDQNFPHDVTEDWAKHFAKVETK